MTEENGTIECPIDVPESDVDLWSDEVLLDPYPTFRKLRDLGPVVWLSRVGLFAVSRYAEVRSVLTSWEAFGSSGGVCVDPIANSLMPPSIIKSDPPEHDAFRRPMTPQLSSRSLAADSDMIGQAAARLVDTLVRAQTFDAVTQLAKPYSLEIVSNLLGIPEHCRAELPDLAEAAFNIFGPANERFETAPAAIGALLEHAVALHEQGALAPGCRAADYSAAVGVDQLIAYTWPGIDTTVNAIGTAVYLFARHPDQWELLRSDLDLVSSAFNEVLRLHAPLHYFTRTVADDAELSDVVLPAGSRVLVMYGSANRDERHYSEPDHFDISRNPTDQLAFGRGVHVCAGKNLAHVEGQTILRELARRIERLELAGQVKWLLNNTLHGFSSVPTVIRESTSLRSGPNE